MISRISFLLLRDIQDALHDLLGGTIQGMMECEMEVQKEERQTSVSPRIATAITNRG